MKKTKLQEMTSTKFELFILLKPILYIVTSCYKGLYK